MLRNIIYTGMTVLLLIICLWGLYDYIINANYTGRNILEACVGFFGAGFMALEIDFKEDYE